METLPEHREVSFANPNQERQAYIDCACHEWSHYSMTLYVIGNMSKG